MKTLGRFISYFLLFLGMSILVPYFFKQMPFIMLPLLMILAVLLIRQDMIEALQ